MCIRTKYEKAGDQGGSMREAGSQYQCGLSRLVPRVLIHRSESVPARDPSSAPKSCDHDISFLLHTTDFAELLLMGICTGCYSLWLTHIPLDIPFGCVCEIDSKKKKIRPLPGLGLHGVYSIADTRLLSQLTER
jgi:hypothetical protein